MNAARRPAAGGPGRTGHAVAHRPGRLGQDGRAKPPPAAAAGGRRPRGPGSWFRPRRPRPLPPSPSLPPLLTGHGGLSGARGAKSNQARDPWRLAGPSSRRGPTSLVLREIPPVTPFVRIKLFADGHTVWTYLWFGYVPGYASAGIALCEVNDGGVYNGYYACTSGRLPAGVLARSAATDGSGWIRLGVTARAGRLRHRGSAGRPDGTRCGRAGPRPAVQALGG